MFIFKKKESYSEFENRYLTKFSLNNVESYLLDNAPFRNELLKLKNKIELLCGKTLVNGVYVANDDYLLPEKVEIKKSSLVIETINDFAKNIQTDVMIVPDSIYINSDKKKTVVLNQINSDKEYIEFEKAYTC